MTVKVRAVGLVVLVVLVIAVLVLGVLCWVLGQMSIVVDTLPPVAGIGMDAEYGRLEAAAIALGLSLLGLGAATGAVMLLHARRSARPAQR